ncbi:MAG: P-II family nitrogen regulator [Thermaurantimonas sp.]|uniref:P-II family nitrogen regulator n=1 Tax=Thermaurantimonas sp. TaxID=2681568 RepID=UPI003919A2E9
MALKSRLEIVIPKPDFPRLKKILEHPGIEGYTVIDSVKGHGQRGDRDNLGLSDSFTNLLVIVVCDEAVVESISPSIRQLISKSGGIASVSTVQTL